MLHKNLIASLFIYLLASASVCLLLAMALTDQLKSSRHKFWEHLFTTVLKCNSPLWEGNAFVELWWNDATSLLI